MAIACNLLIGLIADVVPESYQILGGKEKLLEQIGDVMQVMYHGKALL